MLHSGAADLYFSLRHLHGKGKSSILFHVSLSQQFTTRGPEALRGFFIDPVQAYTATRRVPVVYTADTATFKLD